MKSKMQIFNMLKKYVGSVKKRYLSVTAYAVPPLLSGEAE